MGSVITTDERKREVIETLKAAGLDWFSTQVGFRFLDDDGAECIVIGWGGYRTPEILGSLQLHPETPLNDSGLSERVGLALFSMKMHPATLVGCYLYKGEQFLFSIPDMERLGECKPHPSCSGGSLKNLSL